MCIAAWKLNQRWDIHAAVWAPVFTIYSAMPLSRGQIISYIFKIDTP